MQMGVESLALRYLVSLGLGFFGYLLMLRLWAGELVQRLRGRDNPAGRSNWDLDLNWTGGGSGGPGSASARMPSLQPGGGGDFAGGGAAGDFSGAADAACLPEAGGGMWGSALEAAGSADEGAVVAIPVVAVFLIGCMVFFGAGSLLLVYFGWEALLAVAVELAFSYASARVAVRLVREGWLSAAWRLIWKPLLGAVVCAVILGATIDYFVPAANSLPQAIKLLRAAA